MVSGVLVVDKPAGPTSFDVVRKVRRVLGLRKVGHGGTLDPAASGVLPICLGQATKLAPFLLEGDKQYEATVSFGIETDTYDATGRVVAERSTDALTRERVESVLPSFLGVQEQRPPIYSALKRAGKPLYAYARAGEEVAPPEPRRIEITRLDLLEFETPIRVRLRISCSKGTYIRSLAYDLGRLLGPGAHLAGLRRTRSGPFTLADAISADELDGPRLPLPIVSLADALRHLRAVTVSEAVARALGSGQAVGWDRMADLPAGEGPVRLIGPNAELVAVAAPGAPGERVSTLRVFAPVSAAPPPVATLAPAGAGGV